MNAGRRGAPHARSRSARVATILALVALRAAPAPLIAQDTIPPSGNVAPVARMLERLITHEMAGKRVPAVSIALVDGQQIVWARGFGWARPDDSVPATAETVYRVGSVSKVFTTIALLQLVERGLVALDSALTDYLPEFAPTNPWHQPITARQLLSHRSGLVREPPVGGYADARRVSLAATVASLNRTALVHAPGSWTKYSNAGLAVAGYLVERRSGTPFAAAVRRPVFERLGMRASDFDPSPELLRRTARGVVETPVGRHDAPLVDPGIAPAVGMYSTVLDLGRFLTILFTRGAGPDRRVVARETLESMWQVQYADSGARQGFGLGFGVTELDGHRRVGHDGAIYGHSSTVAFLPTERLGAVVSLTMDLSTGVTARIADAALRGLLAARAGTPIPEADRPGRPSPAIARRLAGHYRSARRRIDLVERGGELFLVQGTFGIPQLLGLLGDTLVVDDRTAFGRRLIPIPAGLVAYPDTLLRRPLEPPAPPPDRWMPLVGEYVTADSLWVLYAHERGGRLLLQLGWVFASPLADGQNGTLRFGGTGPLADEPVVFHRDSTGRGESVEAAGVVFRRRRVGPVAGEQLRVSPLRPVAELLHEARRAIPPSDSAAARTPDLVELTGLDSTLRFDIRYATTNNFLGSVFYPAPRAFLQRPAAEALQRAHRRLRRSGYGLLIQDAYRPWYVTKVFWDATPPRLRWLVANPAKGSRHNRGSAVDVTLYDLATGHPADMGGTYDEATLRSSTFYPVETAVQEWRREVLREALEAEGFERIPEEWWHFDYRGWRAYPIMNAGFEELERGLRPREAIR